MFVLLFSAANRTRPSAPVHAKFHCARCAKSNFYRFSSSANGRKGRGPWMAVPCFARRRTQHLSKEFWRASAALPCQFWALGRWSDGGWAEQGQRVPWPGSSVGTEAGLAQREGFGARCHDEKEVAQPQTSAEDLPDKVQLATQRSWICCTPVFPGYVQDVTWPSHLSTRTRIIGFWFLTRKEGTVDGLPIHGMALVCLPVYHQLLEVCGACHFMIYIYIYWYINSSPSDGVEN